MMNYEQFEKYVREHCEHETIYIDSEGRNILVITMLDAFTIYSDLEEHTVRLDENFPLFHAIEEKNNV